MIKIPHIIKSYKSDENGATAVEFALIALPFLLAIFGIMETGRILWMMNSVEYALADTGRYASLNSELDDTDFTAYAQDILDDMMVPQSGSLDIVSTLNTSNEIDFIQLDANFEVSMMLSNFLPFTNFDISTSVNRPIIE